MSLSVIYTSNYEDNIPSRTIVAQYDNRLRFTHCRYFDLVPVEYAEEPEDQAHDGLRVKGRVDHIVRIRRVRGERGTQGGRRGRVRGQDVDLRLAVQAEHCMVIVQRDRKSDRTTDKKIET